MSLEHFSLPSRSTSEELDEFALGPSRDVSQSEAKVADLVREPVAPVVPVGSEVVSLSERGHSQEWNSQPVEASQDDPSSLCKDVACQTDFECPICIHTLNRMGVAVESRSTQTAPETRSVFTRSSRFLPGRQGCSADPTAPPDDPFMLARVSSRGDSTAVLSRRVRGRFRGRGRGRGRGAAPINAANQNALEQNHQPNGGGRGRQDRRAAGFDTLLALLESRLGEAAVRHVQDPPPAPPPSGRVTTPSSGTGPIERQPSLGSLNASADAAVQVVAYDGDSSSSSDTLFAILAPKNQAPVFRTTSARLAKLQQNLVARAKSTATAATLGQPTPSSHVRPNSPPTNNESTNFIDRTGINVNSPPPPPPPNARALSDQLERDVPVTVASALPIPTIADWITRINPPPPPAARSRRGGVRGFLGRLLGKESAAAAATATRQRGQTRKDGSAILATNAPSIKSVAPMVSVKNPMLIAAGLATRSDSDSTR